MSVATEPETWKMASTFSKGRRDKTRAEEEVEVAAEAEEEEEEATTRVVAKLNKEEANRANSSNSPSEEDGVVAVAMGPGTRTLLRCRPGNQPRNRNSPTSTHNRSTTMKLTAPWKILGQYLPTPS